MIWRRLLAATAVAAVTTTSLAVVPALGVTASAAEPSVGAAGPADAVLSIRAVRPAIRPGASSAVTGRLALSGADAAGRTVVLEARPEGTAGFTPVGEDITDATGVLRITVTPETSTRYRWRYAGAPDARRAVSGVARVKVRTPQHPAHRIRTTLSIVLQDAGPTGHPRIGGRLFAPAAAPARRWVVLVSSPRGSADWGFESAARTDTRGRVVFGVAPHQDTAYRLAFLGTPRLRPARSARVVVRMPTEVSISATPSTIDPQASSTVAGVVTKAGTPVAGAAVELHARTSAGWVVEQTGTAAADGTASFAVTPARTTHYRLRVLHTPGVRAGWSAITRVVVRAPSSLSVRGTTTEQGFVVSGQLRARGAWLRGRTVTLQSMAPGTTDWTTVGTDETTGRGKVRFVQPHVPDTRYRLAYDGESRFLPSVSGTVVS